MPLVTDRAVILQSFAYSETSKVLRVLLREHGLRSLMARGALRPKSRYGGVLEPFTDGTATAYLKEGRELNTLSGFELERSRQRLGTDLLRFGAASLMAELVLRTGSETADPPLFDRLRRALDRIETVEAGLEPTALAEAWGLVGQLGFSPALEECIGCGRALEPDEDAVFDFAAGGVRCPECAGGLPGRPIPPAARATLAALARGAAVPIERPEAHWRLLERFLDHHVLEGPPLRSLEFIQQATGGER